MLGLDYAAKHTEAQLREAMQAGVRFVVRYLAPAYLESKRISRAEADMLAALGLGVVSVYQRRNNQLSDFDLEHARYDANWAANNAWDAGQTHGPIYFAMDFDAQPLHLPVLQAYIDEVQRLIQPGGILPRSGYEVGVYGSYAVIDGLRADHYWQTYAWSGGLVSKKARFLQCKNGVNFAGGANDLNISWGDPGCWVQPKDTSMPVMPELKRGAKGWQVSVLQSLLVREGYHTNGIDGDFGPGTHKAVQDYQTAGALNVDGIAGPATWEALARVKTEDPKDAEIRLLTARVLALQAERDGLVERIERAKTALSG